jgi:hypothetical protein
VRAKPRAAPLGAASMLRLSLGRSVLMAAAHDRADAGFRRPVPKGFARKGPLRSIATGSATFFRAAARSGCQGCAAPPAAARALASGLDSCEHGGALVWPAQAAGAGEWEGGLQGNEFRLGQLQH